MGVLYNENARGGTEIFARLLVDNLPSNLLEKVQIICDRVCVLDENKYNILYLNNTPEQLVDNDKNLAHNGWKQFDKIVFVSYWQLEEYVRTYNIPYSYCTVIPLSTNPLPLVEKDRDEIVLVYHPTPHRGLDILVNVFEKLCNEFSNLKLKVFSSYTIYGELEAQREYQRSDLYRRLEEHPNIDNIGYVSHEEVKKHLSTSHIFAYPSTWRECGCTSIVEAMSAKNICVHSSYGPLPEISGGYTLMYDFTEDLKEHERRCYNMLRLAIKNLREENINQRLELQKKYVDMCYNNEVTLTKFKNLIQSFPLKKRSNLLYT